MSILLKGVLFQLSGRGNPCDDATHTFISDSASSILGLSNDISFETNWLVHFQTEAWQLWYLHGG